MQYCLPQNLSNCSPRHRSFRYGLCFWCFRKGKPRRILIWHWILKNYLSADRICELHGSDNSGVRAETIMLASGGVKWSFVHDGAMIGLKVPSEFSVLLLSMVSMVLRLLRTVIYRHEPFSTDRLQFDCPSDKTAHWHPEKLQQPARSGVSLTAVTFGYSISAKMLWSVYGLIIKLSTFRASGLEPRRNLPRLKKSPSLVSTSPKRAVIELVLSSTLSQPCVLTDPRNFAFSYKLSWSSFTTPSHISD